jgi:transposase/chorismate mutase
MLGDELPADPDALKALLIGSRARFAEERARLMAEVATITAERDAAVTARDRLQAMIAALRRHRFGPRSERLDPDQLALGLEDIEQSMAALDEEIERKTPGTTPGKARAAASPRKANRGALPAHLPRIERIVDVASTDCPCCTATMTRIGEDVAERLDIVPATLRVIVTRRPKYACRACPGTVVQAEAPARLVEGGLPTEELVAQVVIGKYADHLPLYRQAQIWARQGVQLDRSTLCDWVGRAAWWLRPLHERLLVYLRASGKLFADETPAPVLDPGRGRTRTGQLWAYARDDRPWAGSAPPAVAYVFAPDRSAAQVMNHLKGFTGVLQVDGYSAYRKLAEAGAVELAFCWSHARRRFFELAKPGNAPIAAEAVARIAELYAIEAAIRGRDAGQRRAVRQDETAPLLVALEAWLRDRLAIVLQSSPIADAIRYTLRHWKGLCRFLDDGRIEIDSNTVERSIRPLALTRKNALFAGSDGGGAHWAIAASLIETCKLNEINPQEYLPDVLRRLVAGHTIDRLDELLPWAWKAARDGTAK